jgi:hypothetical protein
MTVSSVRSEEDDGAGSGHSSSDETSAAVPGNGFKKIRPNESRPPRPTYTARIKDGKFGEATLSMEVDGPVAKTDDSDNNNNGGGDVKKDEDARKVMDGVTVNAVPPSYHRSRERTRISAVQRLVERKLAQKERERLREREQERDRLSHGKARSSSSSCHGVSGSYVRERSWDATYQSSFGGRSFSASGHCKDEGQLQSGRPRTEKENEYLASLLWRTSRSCSGTRRRGQQSDGEEEVAKTIITIGPGKPTRIREHSPSKRSPTTELPPSRSVRNIIFKLFS